MLPDLRSVKALIILDNDGSRVLSKYYDDHFASLKDKQDFEANLFKKTYQTDFEIIACQGLTVCYKSSVDLLFYVIGSSEENELILVSILTTFFDTVSLIVRKNVEKKAVFDKMDYIILAADELIDDGVLMENDSDSIAGRVYPGQEKDIPLSEQTMTQVLQNAREGFKWTLLR
ncbi:coatomer subunit zeta-1-like [Bolinopsis microptera]|uniref:coatomer subunit zeta-1-like n=1 Tax=Bolinopsis microptera TaxID=2820187 RepID=UPI00307A69F5